MDNDKETLDSSIEEVETETIDSSNDEPAKTDEKYTEREKQLYARLKVAEAKLKASAPKESAKEQSDDFGYDVKAYLKASGIGSNEFGFVKEEMKRSGLGLDALLENEYFQAGLSKHRELAKTADAVPQGKRSGGVPTDSVDYWMAKPIEEVPQEMRIKVVNARLDKERNKGAFYNS